MKSAFPNTLNKPFQYYFEPDDMAFMVVGYVLAQKVRRNLLVRDDSASWGYGRLKQNYPRAYCVTRFILPALRRLNVIRTFFRTSHRLIGGKQWELKVVYQQSRKYLCRKPDAEIHHTVLMAAVLILSVCVVTAMNKERVILVRLLSIQK